MSKLSTLGEKGQSCLSPLAKSILQDMYPSYVIQEDLLAINHINQCKKEALKAILISTCFKYVH